MPRKDRQKATDRIEFTVNLNRRDVEALQLEVRRLAQRYGIGVKAVRIKQVKGKL